MLGRVVSIEEESGLSVPVPRRALAQAAGMQMPIAPGEDTLHATVDACDPPLARRVYR